MKRILYWFIQITWGLLATLLGLFVFLYVIIFRKHKIHKNGYSFITEFGGNWGGLSLGVFSFCGNYSKDNVYWFEHTRAHEYGHSIQNMMFGPLFIFIVAIPSAIRYHYQNYRSKRGLPNKEYDSIWFEGSATRLGERFIDKHER